MGKSWFSAVKKALSPEPKQKKEQVFWYLHYLHIRLFTFFWLFKSIKTNACLWLWCNFKTDTEKGIVLTPLEAT